MKEKLKIKEDLGTVLRFQKEQRASEAEIWRWRENKREKRRGEGAEREEEVRAEKEEERERELEGREERGLKKELEDKPNKRLGTTWYS